MGKKKFLVKLIVASILVGGINVLPMPNIDLGNVQISVAYAENKNFSAKEGAMTDVEYIEAQAKEASRMRAIEAVKEKIASYVRNFSGAKGKLSEDDIAAIAEKFEEVGTAQYKKLFYNAVDEAGNALGTVGTMYEATVTAKFNSKKITEYIKLTEQEKARRIRQARETREKFEELDREYEELRKNARNKTPEQLQGEIKDFDDKISDLEKNRNKNKSEKKDKPKTQQDKNQPMKFSNPVEIGGFGWGNLNHGGVVITGASYISETPIKHGKDVARWEYLKGVARFGEARESVYLHYAKGTDFKIGSEAANSTILYNHMWTTIFKVSAKNDYTMYFLKQHFDSPAPAYHYILIGQRPDGKWVKYFNTEDLSKQYLGNSKNVSIQKVTSNGDTIIVSYARCNRLPKELGGYFYEKLADEFGEFRFKWDEAAKWFGVEKITYNQTPTVQKPAQENKPVINQPIKFSQPVKIGHAGHYKDTDSGGFFFEGTSYNNGDIISGSKNSYGKGLARWGKDKDSLYCEYDSYLSSTRNDRLKFGGKNNFVVQEMTGRDILKIESNKGITIYVLYRQFMYFAYLDIIGCRQDGTWVKYVDFKQLEKQFFEDLSKKYMIDLAYGNHGNKLEYYYNGNFVSTKGDTVIVLYSLWKGWDRLQKGEFRFKWDEAAQWFGVEKIVY